MTDLFSKKAIGGDINLAQLVRIYCPQGAAVLVKTDVRVLISIGKRLFE